MTIQQDLQQDSITSHLVELYTIDLNPIGVAQVFYLTPNTVEGGPVFFSGQEYTPFPISSAGWDQATDGKQPRPTLQIANATQFIQSYLTANNDLVGAKVTRSLTLDKYVGSASYARRNLLNYSQQADVLTSGWLKVSTAINSNVTMAPDGTMTADRMVENTTSTPSSPYFYITQSAVAGGPLTFTCSCYVKADIRTYANLRFDDGAGTNTVTVTVNLATGALKAVQGFGGSNASAAVVDCNNGWYRVSMTATWTSITNVRIFVRPALNDTNYTTSLGYPGVIGNGIFVWGMQLEAGSVMTDYQPTTTTHQPDGVAPEIFASHAFLIHQMTSMDKNQVEFTLATLIDRPGKKFPPAQVLRAEFPGAGLLRR